MELEKAVTPRELTPEQIEWLDILLEDLPLSDDALKAKEYLDAHGIDPNKYFVANGIDPATTFDSVEELKIGDLTLKIPIPNGLTREEQYAPSEDNPQYCSIFKGDNGLSLIVTFQCMRKPPFGKRGMESLRLINLYIYSSSDVYSPLIKKNMNDLGLTFTNMSTPVTLQNTKDSTCFCIRTKCVPVDAKLNDKEISEKAMNYDIYVGSILIRGTLLSFAAHEFYHTSSIQRPLFINWFQQIITSNQ